jgi:hypothetical protein
MTDAERDDYLLEIEKKLREGWSEGRIGRWLGVHRNTARRQIAQARLRMVQGPAEISSNTPVVSGGHTPYPLAILKPTRQPVSGKFVIERDPFQGGRQTQMSGGWRLDAIIPHPDSGDWRLENISPDQLRQMTPADLVTRMVRISPEISRAYFDFLRMANPGHELKAVQPGTDIPDETAQEWLNFFERKLAVRGNRGSANVVYNMMLANLWVRGALFCELVFASDARTFVDIVVPDAYSARFKVVKDADAGGNTFQLIQGSGRDTVVLDRDTVRYVPVDPLPDTPYGTSPVAPGLFPALFLITMLQDARRVVAQQGWPRLDIVINVAEVVAAMPDTDKTNPDAIKAWVATAVSEVAASYSNLEPDQAWVHTNTVEFGTPIGAIGNLEGIGELISVLERMCVRSLKSQPLLFGMPEGVSEANANRQWEVHAQGVQALQNLCAETLSYLYSLALEAEGVAAEAKFKFHELRAIEDLRDAQAMWQRLQNAEAMELLGFKTHDEASMYAVDNPARKETTIGMVGDKPEDNPFAGPQVGADGDDDDVSPNDGDTEGAPAEEGQTSITTPQFRLLKEVFSDPTRATMLVESLRQLSGQSVP